MVAGWPRDLRRAVGRLEQRALRTEVVDGQRVVAGDICGFLEVLGIVHDAEIERQQTGEDRLADYLLYLAENAAWGDEVDLLIRELYLRSTDIDPEELPAFFAWLASLAVGDDGAPAIRRGPLVGDGDDGGPPGDLLRAQPLLAHAPPRRSAAPLSVGVLVAA